MDSVANSSLTTSTIYKTRFKLFLAAVVATVLFSIFGTPESLQPPSKFHRWLNEQSSVRQSGSNLPRLDPATKFLMIIRSPDGSLKRLQIAADTQPDQTQRLVELAHESGLFTDDKSEELRKSVDNIVPIEQLGWEGHMFFEVVGGDLVFRRAVNKREISENIAAQNLIRLFKFYVSGELGLVTPAKLDESRLTTQ